MNFTVVEPGSVPEALAAQASEPGAVLYAGGVQLLADLKLGLLDATCLVSLKGVPGLREIAGSGDTLTVGSGLCFRDVAASTVVARRAPLLRRACAAIGNVRVRGRATVGGNLHVRDPKSDLLPVVLVHDGRVHIAGAKGDRTLGVEEFVAGLDAADPGVITAVTLRHAGWSFGGSRRRLLVRPLLSAACALRVADGRVDAARIALGGLGPRAARLRAVEDVLAGLDLPAVARACAPDALAELIAGQEADDDPEASAAYKHRLSAVLVAESILEAADGEGRQGGQP